MNNGFLYKNKFIIGGAIALAIVGVIVYKIRPTKKDSIMEEDFKLGNTTLKEGDLIFSTPLSKFKEYPIVIVFGGISFATPTWIMNEVPKELLSKAIFVFAPYTMDYNTVSKKVSDFVAKNKIVVKNTSIMGFSAGGLNVQKAPLKQFKFVGLIDPSTRPEYVGLPFTNISKMVYNDGNWGGFPKIKETLPKLAQSVKSGGGDSEKVSLSHAKIPSYFFNKYKDQIA